MTKIVHLMGPTCAGKSTIIDHLLKLAPGDVYPVQIGKLLRAKYGEAYFKGQAAPEHTKDEALQLYFDEINKAVELGKKLVVIDGQPRDLSQAKVMTDTHPGADYYMVHANHAIREVRATGSRAPGPDLDLALARLNNDYKNCYVVMIELLERGIPIKVVDTGLEFDLDKFCAELINHELPL